MISQHCISEKKLIGILHEPAEKRDMGVVLISGYSLPMCDVDYFMSKLARYLCGNGMFVLQLDMRGHGDSVGNLEDVDENTLIEDMEEGIKYLSQFTKNVFFVSRGVCASLACVFLEKEIIKGLVGICPYLLSKDVVKQLWVGLPDRQWYEGKELIEGKEYRTLEDFDQNKIAFFNALGVRLRNILAQKINGNFFGQLQKKDIGKQFFLVDKKKILILFSSPTTKSGVETFYVSEMHQTVELEKYISSGFQRNPVWQYEVSKVICDWLIKM